VAGPVSAITRRFIMRTASRGLAEHVLISVRARMWQSVLTRLQPDARATPVTLLSWAAAAEV